MKIYRDLCYKVENLFIKLMSRKNNDYKINLEKANNYRMLNQENKLAKKLERKTFKKVS